MHLLSISGQFDKALEYHKQFYAVNNTSDYESKIVTAKNQLKIAEYAFKINELSISDKYLDDSIHVLNDVTNIYTEKQIANTITQDNNGNNYNLDNLVSDIEILILFKLINEYTSVQNIHKKNIDDLIQILEIRRKLLLIDNTNTESQSNLATTLQNLGAQHYLAYPNSSKSESYLKEALSLRLALAKEEPNRNRLNDVHTTLYNLGVLNETKNNDLNTAKKYYIKGLNTLREIKDNNLDEFRDYDSVITLLTRLSNIEVKEGNSRKFIEYIYQIINLYKKLAEEKSIDYLLPLIDLLHQVISYELNNRNYSKVEGFYNEIIVAGNKLYDSGHLVEFDESMLIGHELLLIMVYYKQYNTTVFNFLYKKNNERNRELICKRAHKLLDKATKTSPEADTQEIEIYLKQLYQILRAVDLSPKSIFKTYGYTDHDINRILSIKLQEE